MCEKFGPPEVLKVVEKDKPLPKNDEILIRNYASSINTVDIMYRTAKLPPAIFRSFRTLFSPLSRIEFGIRKPKRKFPGSDFAGEIEAVGTNVQKWEEGDRVYGYSDSGGTLAEYVCLPESYRKMTKMPKNLKYEEAGSVPGGAPPALTGLRDKAYLQKDQKILIIGASGGIGSFAVQIAKNIYQAEVTAVCGPNNINMVTSLGADYVIDYTKENYLKSERKYDAIFDVVATISFSDAKNILTKNGLYIANNPLNRKKHLLYMITGNKRFKQGSTNESAENLSLLRNWIENGKVKPVIDTTFTLDQVSEAHRLYETGHAKGRVVITID